MADLTHVAGFVHLQVNGIAGIDVATADGDEWDRIDAALAASGVTTWCPTLTTRADYAGPLARIAAAMQRPGPRPRIAGIHLEGPFLGSQHGAHRSDLVRSIDMEWLKSLPPGVRIVTLGPEQPEAVAATEHLTARGTLTAIGHTGASADRVNEVVAAGATVATHVFNAMTPLGHRQSGPVGAALTNDNLTASVIADGRHLSQEARKIVFRCKPPDRVIVVSDQVAGVATMPDGTLAGGTATMDGAVRYLVDIGIEPQNALWAAGRNAARLVGVEDRDDFVVLDDELNVTAAYVDSECIYER